MSATIRDLVNRLAALTSQGLGKWERCADGTHEWAVPSGIVEVSPTEIKVWDSKGEQRGAYGVPREVLYDLAEKRHQDYADSVIDLLIADLDRIEVSAWR